MKRLEDDQEDPQSDMRIFTSYGKLQNVNIVKSTLKDIYINLLEVDLEE